MTFLRNSLVVFDTASTTPNIGNIFVVRNGVLNFVSEHNFASSNINTVLAATATINYFELTFNPASAGGDRQFWYMMYDLQTEIDHESSGEEPTGRPTIVRASGSIGYRGNQNFSASQVMPQVSLPPIPLPAAAIQIKLKVNVTAICE